MSQARKWKCACGAEVRVPSGLISEQKKAAPNWGLAMTASTEIVAYCPECYPKMIEATAIVVKLSGNRDHMSLYWPADDARKKRFASNTKINITQS